MLSDYEEFLAATGKVFVPTPAKYKSVNEFLKEPDNILLQLRYGLWHGSRVFFHLIAEAVSMGAQWTDKKHIVVQFVLVGHAYPHSGSFPKAHVCSNVIVTYQC